MTKEEIIAIAIREAFKCGREAGEHYQALLDNKQQQLEEAREGKQDHDLKQYDGLYSQLNNVEPESVLLENSSLKAIIKVREEENKKLTEENQELGRICEEKDATITELRTELQANKDALPFNVYTEEAPLEEPPAENDPGEEVDTEHFCKDCRHSNETGPSSVYCCLKELLYEKSAYACNSFNSKPRKKKLPEE